MQSIKFLARSLSLLFPKNCLVCKRRHRQVDLCRSCTPKIPATLSSDRCTTCFSATFNLDSGGRCNLCRVYPLALGKIRYLWPLEGKAKTLIHAMKYAPSVKLCKISGTIAAKALLPLFGASDWDMVVPIPSSAKSLGERGFNQCRILAECVASAIREQKSIELSTTALIHRGNNMSQASLPYEKRISNTRKAFKASDTDIAGKNILLIDDVITTGATATSATLTLLNAGAAAVDLLVLTRANNFAEHRRLIWKGYTPR